MSVNVRERKRKDSVTYEYYFNFDGHRYSKSGFKTPRKAEKEGDKVLAKLIVEKQNSSEKGNMTVNELIQEFLSINKYKYSQSTLYGYHILIHKLNDEILNSRINLITFKIAQSYFNKRDKESYSTNSGLRKLLNIVFQYGMQNGYIQRNPIAGVSVSGVINKNPRTYITQEQFDFILDDVEYSSHFQALKRESIIIALKMGYYVGLRSGEVFALKKSDIDLNAKTIDVNKTLVYLGLNKSEFYAKEGAKTVASTTIVNIPDILVPDLKEWFDTNPYELLCPDFDGTYINPRSMHMYFQSKVKSGEYDFKFNFHMLRHSFAQNLVSHDIDPKTTQELMRHTSFATTMNYYVHSNDKAKIKALNSVFK